MTNQSTTKPSNSSTPTTRPLLPKESRLRRWKAQKKTSGTQHRESTEGERPYCLEETPRRVSTENMGEVSVFTALTEALRGAKLGEAPKYVREPTFNGDPSKWLEFKHCFAESAERFSPSENVSRIRYALRGAAQEATEGLLLTSKDPKVIMKTLERNCGRPRTLLMLQRERISSLPKPNETSNDVYRFANRVATVIDAITCIGKPEYLREYDIVSDIIGKMTPTMKARWVDYAHDNQSEKPELVRIRDIMHLEADRYSEFLTPEIPTRGGKPTPRGVHVVKSKGLRCAVCQEEHSLNRCDAFKTLSIDDRWETVKKLRVCFTCLRHGHRGDNCRSSNTGRSKVSSLLQRPFQRTLAREEKTVTVASTAAAGEEQVLLKMKRVTLKGPQGEMKIFALLDEGSSVTLLDAEIAKNLGLPARAKPFNIIGVNGQKINDGNASQEVTVSIKSGESERRIKARAIRRLNITAQSIRKGELYGAVHLADLDLAKMSYECARPRMLIGQDNWELIVSRELRYGRKD
jgi:hypothetical protein